MKRACLAFVLFLAVSPAVGADDWATTGKGGSAGNLTPAQIEAAWAEMPGYQAGQDQKALLAMNWVVINAMNDPGQRAATAARLAKLLQDPATTADARQFICAQLYQIGTEAEVSIVAPMLLNPATTDMARLFLERIKSEASIAALRAALGKLEGRPLIGVANSLSIMGDEASVEKIIALTKSQDAAVALAAWRALGNFGAESAADFLIDRLKKADGASAPMESAAVRTAILLESAGKQDKAMEIYRLLADAKRSLGARQAGFRALLAATPEEGKAALVAEWSKSPDPAKQKVVISQLTALSDAGLEKTLNQPAIGEKVQVALMEELAARQGEKMLPAMLEAADSGDPAKVQMALRFLASIGDPKVIPVLIKALRSDETSRRIAADALAQRPTGAVGPALLEALNNQVDIREQVVEILSKLRYYEAIDPLVKLARHKDPAVYEGAVEGLRGICDPDDTDLKRMLNLYLDVPAGAQRDYVERAIAYICEKNPDASDRAAILLGFVEKHRDRDQVSFQAAVLPLLGRLGTAAVYKKIQPLLRASQPELSAAAVRALCNWPTAEHAEALWELAEKSESRAYRSQALRAYVRVITLPSDRPEAETLRMLKAAMNLADNNENKNLALSRAAAIRTLEAVDWVAGYLDDPALAQTACRVIVELAHHRFLRQPNKAHFEPILRKVEATAKDKSIAELAEKARLGM
ncbi:MAG: HEAT repeat domain-containing protein [Thermoguttaceae bacterium]|jgi:HEAT repeat protein